MKGAECTAPIRLTTASVLTIVDGRPLRSIRLICVETVDTATRQRKMDRPLVFAARPELAAVRGARLAAGGLPGTQLCRGVPSGVGRRVRSRGGQKVSHPGPSLERGESEENMNSRRSSRQFRLAILYPFLILCSPLSGILTAQSEPPVGRSATPYEDGQVPKQQTVLWDLVVLGRIDACWVCQHGPPPHVNYTKVLAGTASRGKAQGTLDLVEVPVRLLPKGGIPIYRSQQEEICYLKIVELPGNKNEAAYKVVNVEEATPENLAKFE